MKISKFILFSVAAICIAGIIKELFFMPSTDDGLILYIIGLFWIFIGGVAGDS